MMDKPRVVSAEEVHALLDYPGLVEALRELFRRGVDEARSIHLTQKLPAGPPQGSRNHLVQVERRP